MSDFRYSRLSRLISVTAVLAALLTTQVAVAAVASAHDELVGSSPAADAALTTAPQELVLTFSEPPNTQFSEVVVSAPGGAAVTDGGPQVAGAVLTQPLAALTESGLYTVAWRVVSADGHPISGEFGFTVAVPAAATTPAPTSGDAPTTGAIASSDAVISSEESAATTDDGGSGGLVIGLVVVVALALVVGGVLTVRRRQAGTP